MEDRGDCMIVGQFGTEVWPWIDSSAALRVECSKHRKIEPDRQDSLRWIQKNALRIIWKNIVVLNLRGINKIKPNPLSDRRSGFQILPDLFTSGDVVITKKCILWRKTLVSCHKWADRIRAGLSRAGGKLSILFERDLTENEKKSFCSILRALNLVASILPNGEPTRNSTNYYQLFVERSSWRIYGGRYW